MRTLKFPVADWGHWGVFLIISFLFQKKLSATFSNSVVFISPYPPTRIDPFYLYPTSDTICIYVELCFIGCLWNQAAPRLKSVNFTKESNNGCFIVFICNF